MLNVAPDLLEMKISACALVARGVDNTRTVPELIAYRRKVGRQLAAFWKNRSVSSNTVIREYHRLHGLFGVKEEPTSPEKLIMYVRRNRDFTAANAVVDSYNIVSAKTMLSIGAHDLAKLATPVTLRRLTAEDVFVPLGETRENRLPGEYGYVDPEGRVICRLEVLQCEYSKVEQGSRDIVFFIQGNREVGSTTLLKGTWLLAELIETFCRGRVQLVSFSDSGGE